MMKYAFIIAFIAITLSTIAQTNLVTFAPMGIVNKFRIKFERNLNENVSTGLYFNGYFNGIPVAFRGIRVDPFIRLYPTGKAPKGFYIQGKAVMGYFSSNMEYEYLTLTDTLSLKSLKSFPTYGAGLGLGYQFLIGRGEMPIDLFLGFQYSKFTAPQIVLKDGNEYATANDVDWYLFGPGSFFNANFGIGFSF